MALNDFLKKITIDGIDTKGLYYKDTASIFAKNEINRGDLNKINYQQIDIIVKLYFRDKQIKKTLTYYNLTGLQATKQAITDRNVLKKELEDKGVIVKKTFISLNDFWNEYIEHKRVTLSADNIYSMQKYYDKWISPRIGEMNFIKIVTADIQSIVKDVLRAGKKPRTAKTIQDILRPLFNFAIDKNIIQMNPAVKLEIPKFDNTVDFELSDERRLKLFDEIQKYEIMKYRGIMLFLYYGRRLNEALTLNWNSIHFDQNIYVVEAIYAKNTRRTEYPLPLSIKEFLMKYGVKKSGFIFPGEKTKHVTESTFRRHWKEVIKNAGIDHMRIHDTRHALGNTFINRGESLENIGKVLGHSSIAVTRRYAKTSLKTADRLLSDY